jgi:hypothetical protein
MAHREEGENVDRIFTISEANRLLPQIEEHLCAVKSGKAVLLRIKDEIKKAAANAHLGGGSHAGRHYINALQEISTNLQAIHEMGVLVKDVDMGLCDFPYLMQGRIVFLCWKLGEPEIRWWHEVHTGFASRQPIEECGE